MKRNIFNLFILILIFITVSICQNINTFNYDGRYIQTPTIDDNVVLSNGYYYRENDDLEFFLNDEHSSITISNFTNVSFDRFNIEVPHQCFIIINAGDIVKENQVIAFDFNEEIKSETNFRCIKVENNIIFCEKIIDDIMFSFKFDMSQEFKVSSFYTLVNGIKYNLFEKSFDIDKFNQMYVYTLSGLNSIDSLLNGMEIIIILECELYGNYVLNNKCIFKDELGFYVKKMQKTAKYGDVYTKKYVTIIKEYELYSIVSGVSLYDTYLYN